MLQSLFENLYIIQINATSWVWCLFEGPAFNQVNCTVYKKLNKSMGDRLKFTEGSGQVKKGENPKTKTG